MRPLDRVNTWRCGNFYHDSFLFILQAISIELRLIKKKAVEITNLGFEEKEEISAQMNAFHLVELRRLKNPSSDLTIACRIDRFLISKSLIK